MKFAMKMSSVKILTIRCIKCNFNPLVGKNKIKMSKSLKSLSLKNNKLAQQSGDLFLKKKQSSPELMIRIKKHFFKSNQI